MSYNSGYVFSSSLWLTYILTLCPSAYKDLQVPKFDLCVKSHRLIGFPSNLVQNHGSGTLQFISARNQKK